MLIYFFSHFCMKFLLNDYNIVEPNEQYNYFDHSINQYLCTRCISSLKWYCGYLLRFFQHYNQNKINILESANGINQPSHHCHFISCKYSHIMQFDIYQEHWQFRGNTHDGKALMDLVKQNSFLNMAVTIWWTKVLLQN